MIVRLIDRLEVPALTPAQTAQVMTERGYPLTAKQVVRIESRALRKLARTPGILSLFAEVLGESKCI